MSRDNEYDAIVIGSGLGGLTAGALFARAGHRVLLLEQNDSFGGAATTYHKGAMMIEASLQATTDPRTTLDSKGEIFDALNLYDDIEFVSVDNFYEVRCPLIGEPLTIPHGLEALGDYLVKRFPQEEDNVRRFLKQLGSIQKAMKIFTEKHDGLWWLAHGAELPYRLWPLVRDLRSSVSQVMQRYFGDNEAIKIALAANLLYYSDDPDQMWWLFYAVVQDGFFRGGGNYIKGGSQVLSEQLADRIRAEGGNTLTGQSAVEILLSEEGEVSGVRYRPRGDGDEVIAHAPIVFANASPHVVEPMLPEAERDRFMAPYRDKPLSISLFSMTFGLSKRPAELGLTAYSTVLIPSWMQRLSDLKKCGEIFKGMPGERLPLLGVTDYSHIDSGLTNSELFPISVAGADRLSNWEGLSDEDYQSKKNAWVNTVIQRLEDEWPGFANAVVQQEFATARTMQEYLKTPDGAVYGFAPNIPQSMLLSGPPRTPKTSVKGLWLASSYGGAGGFTGAMSTGGWAAKAALS